MSYTIEIKPSAQRQIRKLDSLVIKRIIQKLQSIQQDPRPAGVRKLRNVANGYRIRVGDWRILYTIDDHSKEIQVYRVKHRAKVY